MRQSGSQGAQLLTWMRENSELNWMPERLLKPLARDIAHDRHFDRFFRMVKDMRSGIKPDKAAYMRLVLDVATQSRLQVPENGLVLFSGAEGASARAAVLRNDKLYTNHRTPATAMLELLNTFGKSTTPLETTEERYLPWRLLSVRLVQQAKGDVRAYVKNAAPDRTFRQYELAPLIDNPAVTAINGKPKAEWVPQITGRPNVRRMIAQGQQVIIDHMASQGDVTTVTAVAGKPPPRTRENRWRSA